jgi:PIN domain nuclease of toxin-antitoxin system
LTARVSAAITDPESAVQVSAVTIWEVEIKRKLGRLRAPPDLLKAVVSGSMSILPVAGDHAVAAGSLPLHHSDPFDRMLVAQAQIEGLTLVTADERLRAYDVAIMPALG